MNESRIKLKVGVSGDTKGFVCFEPNGMAYELEPEDHVYASVTPTQLSSLEIVYWSGGVSVWITGEFTTLDKDGKELDQLWGG